MKHSKILNRILKKAKEVDPLFPLTIGKLWALYIHGTTKHDRKSLRFEQYCQLTIEELTNN